MQKEDYQWVIVALGVLVVFALIIEPVATNEPPNFSLPDLPAMPAMPVLPSAPHTVTTPPATMATPQPVTAVPTPVATVSSPPASTPVPAQTALVWNGSTQTVGFVDPSTYNVSLTTYTPRQFANQSAQPKEQSRNYTSLLKAPITGQFSGTTQVVGIPVPYWELWYTIEPTLSDMSKLGDASGGSYVIQPTQGQGVSASGAQGSYSTVKPTFTVDIMEANTSRLVRSVTPWGSIDPSLWKDNDPRPWKEKFFEGQKSYYFIIKAGSIKSYSLDIKVPNNYLGKI